MSASFDKINTNIDGLIDPLVVTNRYYICPKCKSQRVELMSFNGYPQNYKDAVECYARGYTVLFDKYEIRSMRCRACTSEFMIDWTSGFPTPLISTFKTNRFFVEFVNGF